MPEATGSAYARTDADPRESARRRDTCPAACHYFSKTGEDSWGLQGNGKGQQVPINSLPIFDLITKVARRQRFSKKTA